MSLEVGVVRVIGGELSQERDRIADRGNRFVAPAGLGQKDAVKIETQGIAQSVVVDFGKSGGEIAVESASLLALRLGGSAALGELQHFGNVVVGLGQLE